MTHPALYSLEDCINALDAALHLDGLSIIERQVLSDMRDDLHQSADINTFQDVVNLANRQAQKGFY